MKILNFIKNALSGNTSLSRYDVLIDKAHSQLESNTYWWAIKANEVSVFNEEIMTLSDKEKANFILFSIKSVADWNKSNNGVWNSQDKGWQISVIKTAFLTHLMRTKINLDDEDIESIFHAFKHHKMAVYANFLSWPINLFVTQIQRKYKDNPVSEKLANTLKQILKEVEAANYTVEKDKIKIKEKIEGILYKTKEEAPTVRPTKFLGKDLFSEYANPFFYNFNEKDKPVWYKLIAHAQKASGAKPTRKFLEEGKILFKELGADKFKKVINDWFDFLIHLKDEEKQVSQYYRSIEFISSPNSDAVKGLVWMCSHFHDSLTLKNIARLAERCYKKIPGKGPAAAGLGNSCLYTLYKSKGLEGISHLSRLKLRIKQNNTQNLIEKYLQDAAKEQGVSVHEIEDLATDSYQLVDGKREYVLEGYNAVVKIVAVGKSEVSWFKPDGSPQKSAPAIVKEKQSAKLKKIKEIAKQVEVTVSAQRDRIDRMFKAERKMDFDYFNEFYFSHGLMSFLTKKIIWTFENDEGSYNAIFHKGNWVNYKREVFNPGKDVKVSLWHPCTSFMLEIKEWRSFLMENQILQPLKQAYREVYLLTDAEVNTKSYSNRMAAHILKQHQFNTLAKGRGWKYSLLGAYDDGRDNESAEINLPDFNLKAEFWVNEVNSENEFNDTGIWNYVATDQVRFSNTQTNEVLDLINIPKVLFSEVMRDVDLFVGVASVGNDPTWQDSGGVPAYRDYWQSYSFGELTEVAKTRKEILEGLIPRLKIAKVASIKDKFLVIRGKLRTYKIHIGSTNILMEPNDQYLCIVPDRSKKGASENLFLPFEGDNGLSIILSKAFLLVDDDKITDSTITSQIRGRFLNGF